MYQVKISILNDTDYHLYMPSDDNADGTSPDLVFNPPSYLGPGSERPPRIIPPRDIYNEPLRYDAPVIWAPTNKWDFLVCSPQKPISPATTAPTPSGSLRLVLAGANHEINLEWHDFSKWTVKQKAARTEDTVAPPEAPEAPAKKKDAVSFVEGDPVSLTVQRLRGAQGDLQVDLSVQTKDLVYHPNPGEAKDDITAPSLIVNMVVRVREGSLETPPPQRAPAVMPSAFVAPAGSSKVVVAKTFHRWNDKDLPLKRRLLLAYLGCILPLEYKKPPESKEKKATTAGTKATTSGTKATTGGTATDTTAEEKEDFSQIENSLSKLMNRGSPTDASAAAQNLYRAAQPLTGAPDAFFRPIQITGWEPGKKAKGSTSCVSLNTMIEIALTGRAGYWAFHQYELEEAWVPFGVHPLKKMPNVGDPYVIFRDKTDNKSKANAIPHTVHCGFILHVPTDPKEPWITADAGQFPQGSAGFLNAKKWVSRIPVQAEDRRRRRLEPGVPTKLSMDDQRSQRNWEMYMKNLPFADPVEGQEYIFMAGGAESDPDKLDDANRLIGWLDLDMIPFSSMDLLDALTEWKAGGQDSWNGLTFHRLKGEKEIHPTMNDYWFLGAWIDKLIGLWTAAQPTSSSSPQNSTTSPNERSTKIEDWIAHFKSPSTVGPPKVPSSSLPSV